MAASYSKRFDSPGPEPHRPPLCCAECGTDSHVLISSLVAPSPVADNSVSVFYSCTKCGRSYRQVADFAQFGGLLTHNGASHDLLVFSGHYIHCGQSMQQTASGFLRLDGRIVSEECGKSMDVYLDIRVLECPCGFRLVLPD